MVSLLHRAQRKAVRSIRSTPVGIAVHRFQHRGKELFECPICGYEGPFLDASQAATGLRLHALCPKCSSAERHRLQRLVLAEVDAAHGLADRHILHFAPEPFFADFFRSTCRRYESADLMARGVDHSVDLRDLPFDDDSYDMVYASHVLEHITEDTDALVEIARVLKPGGLAILPVPIVADTTVEYPAPNPHEYGHVRAPGPDYFAKYEPYFAEVHVYDSSRFPERHQTRLYEDRSVWPSTMPHRPAMPGSQHLDYVPVCVK